MKLERAVESEIALNKELLTQLNEQRKNKYSENDNVVENEKIVEPTKKEIQNTNVFRSVSLNISIIIKFLKFQKLI